MAKRESIQKRLQRIRPPRVQLTYDVEIGDSIEQKEVPFALGVLGDFSANSEKPQPRLKDKKFINVDMENIDEVMAGIEPRAFYRVPNKLTEKGGEFAVDLKFKSIDDFRPEAVVLQIEPLRKLLEVRTKLADLRNKLAGNETLEDILAAVLTNTEQLELLGKETGAGKAREAKEEGI